MKKWQARDYFLDKTALTLFVQGGSKAKERYEGAKIRRVQTVDKRKFNKEVRTHTHSHAHAHIVVNCLYSVIVVCLLLVVCCCVSVVACLLLLLLPLAAFIAGHCRYDGRLCGTFVVRR